MAGPPGQPQLFQQPANEAGRSLQAPSEFRVAAPATAAGYRLTASGQGKPQ